MSIAIFKQKMAGGNRCKYGNYRDMVDNGCDGFKFYLSG